MHLSSAGTSGCDMTTTQQAACQMAKALAATAENA